MNISLWFPEQVISDFIRDDPSCHLLSVVLEIEVRQAMAKIMSSMIMLKQASHPFVKTCFLTETAVIWLWINWHKLWVKFFFFQKIEIKWVCYQNLYSDGFLLRYFLYEDFCFMDVNAFVLSHRNIPLPCPDFISLILNLQIHWKDPLSLLFLVSECSELLCNARAPISTS